MKRIFDPIHDFIELDDAEMTLVDLPQFQRLRRLRQLGLAYLAYPSAEHSRFSHALGAMAAGSRVFDSLVAHCPAYFSDGADVKEQRTLLRAALLLHDIGHGPFSHACEAVLGVRHEARTRAIFAIERVAAAIAALGLDVADVLGLIDGSATRFPVLAEIVSGPNLDADRMDYLLRDAYFTGVASGKYDHAQLASSLRVYERNGRPLLGIDGRGVVALESFVLARYMMFASVYFHHTTRTFERILQEVLRELWPDPHALDEIDTFMQWDDIRVQDAIRSGSSRAARALRERKPLYVVAAEFNAAERLDAFEACERELRARYGEHMWADRQEQLLHRLPLSIEPGAATVWVGSTTGVVDAREASDLIAKLSGKAYWRKLFVEREYVSVREARELCRQLAQK